MNFIAVKERESQRWFITGRTEQYQTTEHTGKRTRKIWKYKTWVIPFPEHVSPFIETHKIVEAATLEEAQCLISNWK